MSKLLHVEQAYTTAKEGGRVNVSSIGILKIKHSFKFKSFFKKKSSEHKHFC